MDENFGKQLIHTRRGAGYILEGRRKIDSIRLRLTLWYVGVLALVIIAFAGVTYFLVVETLNRRNDENLAEMARNFKAAVNSD